VRAINLAGAVVLLVAALLPVCALNETWFLAEGFLWGCWDG
jgi:hypothetical protein